MSSQKPIQTVAGSFFSNKLVVYILVIDTHFVELVFPFGQFIFLEFCIAYVRQIRYWIVKLDSA